MCRSEWQTPACVTSSSTCRPVGSGVGSSISCSGFFASTTAQARIAFHSLSGRNRTGGHAAGQAPAARETQHRAGVPIHGKGKDDSMSDVLSRILGGVLGGGTGGSGYNSSPLGVPQSEAGRSGGAYGGSGYGGAMPGGGLGGLLGGGGMGGGLGGLLGGLLGGRGMGGGMGGGGLGGLAGGLGGMKGVALMALLAYMMRGQGGRQGLSSLTDHLRGAGLGNHVDSWVGNGPNQEVAPDELARAIPPEMLDEVQQHTGMGRDEVLSELSRGLPQMVHKLTPNGRLPDHDHELNDHDEGDLLSGFGIGPTRRT
jgi:uncharacterized protein YidB (DUF937 family)